jgi:Xaa-Pro aminopeptidase
LLDAMAAGASTRRIYDVYLKKLSELDLPPISFIAHGMGLHLHEDPYLGPTPDQPLEAGMVLAFEPLVFETGFNFGMQIKDVVLIKEGRCELLSDFTNTDRLITVS